MDLVSEINVYILLRYIYRYCIKLPIHSYQCIMAQYKELFN